MPQIAGGKKYILPPWRINEILLEVFSVLSAEEYYKEGFDYKRMIEGMGIKVKKFSSFSPENLKRFKENSLSLWNEGVCLLFPDDETGKQLRMIAYNDSHNATETMQITLHEFAHIRLRHTQQSINGEVEATCFSIAMKPYVHTRRKVPYRNENCAARRERLFYEQHKRVHRKKGGGMKAFYK